MGPFEGWNKSFQTEVMATSEATYGKNASVLKIPLPKTFWLRIIARANDATMVSGTVPIQYMMVFLSAALKNVSHPSLLKLLSPSKESGLEPSQFINARAKAKMIGIRVNTQNPIKLGAMKEYATRSRLVCLVISFPLFTLSNSPLHLDICPISFFFSLASFSV